MNLNCWFCIDSRALPFGSILSLLITWIGLLLFSYKLYQGADIIADLSRDLFAFLLPWITVFKVGLILLCIFMISVTSAMAVVGLLATKRCRNAYVNDPNEIRLGNRFICGIFLILSYSLNVCWMGVLSIVVTMTSAYVAFAPICLPDAGHQSTFCLNFTLMSVLMNELHKTPITKLVLCGEHVDGFCKLTKGILPWFWGAYIGCIAVLTGLAHFNSCLSANFAHGKHARRYRKIHRRNQIESEESRQPLVYVDEHGRSSTSEPELTKYAKSI